MIGRLVLKPERVGKSGKKKGREARRGNGSDGILYLFWIPWGLELAFY